MHVSGSEENFKQFTALVLKLLMKNIGNLSVRLFVVSLLTFSYFSTIVSILGAGAAPFFTAPAPAPAPSKPFRRLRLRLRLRPKCVGSGGSGSGSASLIAIVEKQSMRSKKGPLCYILDPPGLTQEMEFMGHGGEDLSRPPPPGFSSHV